MINRTNNDGKDDTNTRRTKPAHSATDWTSKPATECGTASVPTGRTFNICGLSIPEIIFGLITAVVLGLMISSHFVHYPFGCMTALEITAGVIPKNGLNFEQQVYVLRQLGAPRMVKGELRTIVVPRMVETAAVETMIDEWEDSGLGVTWESRGGTITIWLHQQ